MKRMLLRNCFREIRKARNRFLSILAITALGVGFFAGVRSSSPDMRLGADQYYDQNRLMDIKVSPPWDWWNRMWKLFLA